MEVYRCGTAGFWDFDDRLKELSAEGDPLEKLGATVDFEMLLPLLAKAFRLGHRSKGGRPGLDPVQKFKMLVPAVLSRAVAGANEIHGPRPAELDPVLRAGPRDAVPDANTLWDFREALTAARALDKVFERLDQAINAAGYLPMGGQIIDATLVAAPKQRNTDAEKAAIKAGAVPAAWKEKPAKLRQKDRDARWTVKFAKAKPRQDDEPQIDVGIPFYGYKRHVSIDRRQGIVRRGLTTDAAAHDGARLRAGAGRSGQYGLA